MKVKLLNTTEWNSHKQSVEAQFKSVGTFQGHKGVPDRYPCYVVSYVEATDSMDYYIRHVSVSRDEFYQPEAPEPTPHWRLPLMAFMGLVFLAFAIYHGSDIYAVYNPPAIPVQVQECQKNAEETYAKDINTLNERLKACQRSLEYEQKAQKEVSQNRCDEILAEKRAELLRKIRLESYEVLTLTGKDEMDYKDVEECY